MKAKSKRQIRVLLFCNDTSLYCIMEYLDFEKEAEAANGLKVMVLWSSPLVSFDCGVILLDWPL